MDWSNNDACMKFYDMRQPLHQDTDASGICLSAGLLQLRYEIHCVYDETPDNIVLWPIAVARKSLSCTERQYRNKEKKVLWILYGLENSITTVLSHIYHIISYFCMVLWLCEVVKNHCLWMVFVHILYCLNMYTNHTPSPNLESVCWFQVSVIFSHLCSPTWAGQCTGTHSMIVSGIVLQKCHLDFSWVGDWFGQIWQSYINSHIWL